MREIPRLVAVAATQPQQVAVHHGQGPIVEIVERDAIERLRRKVGVSAHHTPFNERAPANFQRILAVASSVAPITTLRRMSPEPVKLSELVATLSLVSDLGMGRPMERVLRQTVIAMRLADDRGGGCRGLCRHLLHVAAHVGGMRDRHQRPRGVVRRRDAAVRRQPRRRSGRGDDGGLPRQAPRSGRSRLRRIGMVGKFLATAGRCVQAVMESHCQSTSELAGRLDLGDWRVPHRCSRPSSAGTARACRASVGKAELAPAIRLVHLADDIEAFHHTGGLEAAVEVAQRRAEARSSIRSWSIGSAPTTRVLPRRARLVLGLGQVIALDPRLGEDLTTRSSMPRSTALGDFADLKSPLRLGHSRGVAELAAVAGATIGLADDERRPCAEPAASTTSAWSVCPAGCGTPRNRGPFRSASGRAPTRTSRSACSPVCRRCIGRRLRGAAPRAPRRLGLPAWAARRCDPADGAHPGGRRRVQALRQAAPAPAGGATPTPPHDASRQEVRAGRLDGDAVNAVLASPATGSAAAPSCRRDSRRREAEVLVQLARGLSNPRDRRRS